MTFKGEVGFYNFETKIAHTFNSPVQDDSYTHSE